MREKNRKTIEIEKMLPQFTTMNVIDGQAGLMSYSSLIFYSLTIDNILNIIVITNATNVIPVCLFVFFIIFSTPSLLLLFLSLYSFGNTIFYLKNRLSFDIKSSLPFNVTG